MTVTASWPCILSNREGAIGGYKLKGLDERA